MRSSSREFDRCDDWGLAPFRERRVFIVELKGLFEVREGLLDALTLARNLDLETAGNVPGWLVADRNGKSHPLSLGRAQIPNQRSAAQAAVRPQEVALHPYTTPDNERVTRRPEGVRG